MSKITAITKSFRSLLPKVSKTSTAIKTQPASIFQEVSNNVKYINNVLVYPSKKSITPEEVKALFVDGEIYGGYFREQMLAILQKFRFKNLGNLYWWDCKSTKRSDTVINVI